MGSKQVLVIDDEVGIQHLLKTLLEMEGYRVVLTHNGLEALEEMRTLTPDIILLDLLMPTMNGYAFLEAFQHHPLYSSTPILVLTANPNAAKDLSLLAVEGVLLKPFHRERLLTLVTQIIAAKEKTTHKPL